MEVLGAQLRGVAPRVLGWVGLASGLIAFTSVILGFPSWMLLGASLVVWALTGWALFFQATPNRPVLAALGAILVLSAAAAAFVVLSGLYLRALGPSWIL